MKRYLKISLILIISLGFTACKSKKSTAVAGKLNKKLSAKALVKSHKATEPHFKTLSARVKVGIVDGEKSSGYTVNLRMEKDKQILLSSTPITLVKAIITPNRVAFYNKLDGTFFDGDFSYITQLLGTELDYEKVQNLLLGEPVYNVNAKDYSISLHEKSYVLAPKVQADLFELFLLFNPQHYKLDSQQIAQKKDSRFLEINYLKYQDIQNQKFPETTRIVAVEDKAQMIINLDFKGVSLNEQLRFPFKIPQGYKKIELE